MTWLLLAAGLLVGAALLHRGMRWGSTAAERSGSMPGDDYLAGGPSARVAMTRAIWIDAPPAEVWPWIAQLGRGAGFYSIDWLDNGRRASARHIVSWIPEPAVGDATAIGYLRHIDPGEGLAWWVDEVQFFRASTRLTSSYTLESDGGGTRLVSRMSADASGFFAHLALFVFRVMDTIMARRQLLGIRDGVEARHGPHSDWRARETGAPDQYQLYEIIYASGRSAGLKGKEHGGRYRASAMRDGVIRDEERQHESRDQDEPGA